MHKLIFRPLAKDDIQKSVDYYDLINPKLSDIYLKELDDTINNIQNKPEAFQKQLGEIRVAFLKRFKFGIYYKLYDQTIVVLAVLHTSRNPQIWKKR